MRSDSDTDDMLRQRMSSSGGKARVQARAAHLFATCAMGSWFLLGIIPIVVILYSMT
ncbi:MULTISPECIES: hypothetical protein [Acetobacter]|nr:MULTISPECIES: hypothetical protein [Acetobacter]MBC9007667.1 hypothetical protein [Acetobacter tropicalis]MCC6104235.1 hypothetical protein [Acetobacter sp.]MCG4257554.1 hypothetical protein [Acetobacter senegalensis]MCG4259572.1 hypothetical protein [Acetobacter senegalensis]MCG4267620.1 hypothetical protein [Acetobacter senegalensis]